MDIKSISSCSDRPLSPTIFSNRPATSKAITFCSWTSLFSFTRKAHAGILLAALAATALVASLKTLLSVFLGRIFEVVSQLADGTRSQESALAEVSRWCIVLVGLGLSNWMANTSFLSFWTIFGELQANQVRIEVTSGLLSRNVEWFGHLQDGIEVLALATRNLDSEMLLQKQCLQSASTVAAASLSGIDIVRVFCGSGREKKTYGHALRLASGHFSAQARCNSIQMGCVAFWSIAIFVLGFWYGLALVEQGLSPGHVVTTFYAVLTAFHGVESFASHWLVCSKGKSAAQFLRHLAQSEKVSNAPVPAKGSIALHTCAGKIQLNQVDFAYQSNVTENVVKRVTMQIPPNELTFLVGDSGSGKSTLCSLMTNLLTPTAGEVLIDGYPIHQIQPSCLRRHISLIQQNNPVIHDSFFNNVAYGSRCPENVTAMDIREACAFAQLESTVLQLHNGLDTIVGPKSSNLSGGQRQRLALSRAWLRNPAILILDEPTSALDSASQFTVMNAIREWRRDKTTIIVTHDMSNIRDEDFVFIMKSGFSAGRNSSIPNSRTEETPISLSDGWRITDDLTGKKQQFLSYLDRHFYATDTSSTPGKTQSHGRSASSTRETDPSFPYLSDLSFANGTLTTRQLGCKNRNTEFEQPTDLPDPLPYNSVRDILSTVWPSLGLKDRLYCALALLLCLVAAAATPAFSFCLAKLMGAMWFKTNKLQQGFRWAVYLIGIAVTDGICTGGGHFLFEKVSQTWVDQLRQDIFGKVLDQPSLWCRATWDNPKQLSRCLDRNAQEMRIILSQFVPISMVVVAILAISVLWAMAICWQLALVALSPLPLYVLAIKMYVGVSSKWEKRCNEAASDSSVTLEDILLNFSFIRAFGLGPYFYGKQSTTSNKAWQIGLQRAIYTGPWFGLYHSISLPLTALIFYYGTSLIAQETRNIGVSDMLQVINLLLFSIGTSFELLNGLPQLTGARVAATELLRYADLTTSIDTGKRLLVRPDSPLPIQMRNVNLTSAESSARILSEVTYTIIPGSWVAIVGSSGSGKTTMLSLLLGLTTPDTSFTTKNRISESSLRFGGVPYSILDLQHVRSKMAYVPQQPFLFPATIRDNIAYGIAATCPISVQEIVTQAAKVSGIHDFIVSLPDGYDTIVGDGGQALSGGQAQLVNIARALARRPRLLVLDEPSSALDSESTSDICKALKSLIQSSCWQQDGMAVVVATHSVDMMQMADEVVVLDKGCKVEQGTYGDLMANRGHLWELFHQSRL
ncbi:hypothetical protein E4U55_000030 [Claviceps digitariae]|nr:hypothetical protein E4U55_000030 [Claviceps digitariae]